MVMRKGSKKGAKDNEQTPTWFLRKLYQVFDFDFDPCPIDPDFDGLKVEWGKRNYVNPPYSKKQEWIEKALIEQKKGKFSLMLLPVDTSTKWFLDLIEPNRQIIWIHRRLNLDNGYHPDHASMLAIFFPKF